MPRTLRRCTAVTVVGSLGAGCVLLAATSAAAVPGPRPAAGQEYYWAWTDGVSRHTRVFHQSEYSHGLSLPGLQVRVDPVRPQRRVALRYRDPDDRRWRLADRGVTSTNGEALVLGIGRPCGRPERASGWCSGTWDYRLVAEGAEPLRFTITFVRG